MTKTVSCRPTELDRTPLYRGQVGTKRLSTALISWVYVGNCDCVVVVAVRGEPVSTPEFPCFMGIYREICVF